MAVTEHQEESLFERALSPDDLDTPIPVTRRRIDHVLVALGAVAALVLAVAGGLLLWGNNFAEDYVSDELGAQNISFPDAESLAGQGRDDLVKFAGVQVSTGEHAEAYASFIEGHIANIADGQTYAELGGPERAAKAAVTDAVASGASPEEVAALQDEAAELTAQRDSIFRGEMLRGTLLNAFAWSTMGRIAGIAATVAFVGAAVTALLVGVGAFRLRKRPAE